eukprot:TRINITY_DN17080_c0_g1_i2.p1 TRINITY_DN17080_c0_g1~~TRINITY_DN17080_c0_g1_i2.p1  ORF type:complete len:685 (+),score=218.56 TRINITY_DN17080_c0_g1_i2:1893-3947(+)
MLDWLGSVNGANEMSQQGVDLYVFGLLCEELQRDELLTYKTAPRPQPDSIGPGTMVTTARAVPMPGGKFLDVGVCGVVRDVPGADGSFADVDFRGTVTPVREGDVELLATDSGWDQYVRVMFHAMDRDRSGMLRRSEFMALYQMLKLRVAVVTDGRIFAERLLSRSTFESTAVQRIISFGRGRALHWMVNFAAVTSVAFTVVHFEAMERGDSTPRDDSWYQFMYAEMAVGVIFNLEVLIRLFSHEWNEYWHKKWHRFDVVMALANLLLWFSFFGAAAAVGPRRGALMVLRFEDNPDEADSTPLALMPLLLGRLLRCLRLASDFRPFRHILKTFSNILPMFVTYLMAGMLTLYWFAMLGIAVIGETRPPAGTAFAEANYYSLHFGNFYHAMVTLFCLHVVSNWHLVADGYRAAKGDWILVYFCAFWVVMVILLVNIVGAFVIEVWGSQWELNKDSFTCVSKHPLARRVLALNSITPDDSNYVLLSLKSSYSAEARPRWRVTYADYSHKVQLALEHIFLGEQGITHILEGGAPDQGVRSAVAFRRLRDAAKMRVLNIALSLSGGKFGSAVSFKGRRGEGKTKFWERLPADVRVRALELYIAEQAQQQSPAPSTTGSPRVRSPALPPSPFTPSAVHTLPTPGGSPNSPQRCQTGQVPSSFPDSPQQGRTGQARGNGLSGLTEPLLAT